MTHVFHVPGTLLGFEKWKITSFAHSLDGKYTHCTITELIVRDYYAYDAYNCIVNAILQKVLNLHLKLLP